MCEALVRVRAILLCTRTRVCEELWSFEVSNWEKVRWFSK